LVHFGQCLTDGAEPDTQVLEAVRDIELVAAIVKKYLAGKGEA
jgi:hypothetical protein